jgi:hypothetical protein
MGIPEKFKRYLIQSGNATAGARTRDGAWIRIDIATIRRLCVSRYTTVAFAFLLTDDNCSILSTTYLYLKNMGVDKLMQQPGFEPRTKPGYVIYALRGSMLAVTLSLLDFKCHGDVSSV